MIYMNTRLANIKTRKREKESHVQAKIEIYNNLSVSRAEVGGNVVSEGIFH